MERLLSSLKPGLKPDLEMGSTYGAHYPAIATHDTTMIEHAKRLAIERGIGKDQFEFQMLYGIRRDLQAELVRQGYGVRVYIPFGREWFPYFMRRLGERPANLSFVLRSLFSERRVATSRHAS
jgi:proline dehydrogenase